MLSLIDVIRCMLIERNVRGWKEKNVLITRGLEVGDNTEILCSDKNN